MRRTYPVRVGELWADFLKGTPGLSRKLAEARIPELWEGIVGEVVARHTTAMEVRRGTLYVSVSSAPARRELFMQRTLLPAEINKALGMDVVARVIIR